MEMTAEQIENIKKQREIMEAKEKGADLVTSDQPELDQQADDTEADGLSESGVDKNARDRSPTPPRDVDMPPSRLRVTELLNPDDEDISFCESDVPKIADVKVTKTQIVS